MADNENKILIIDDTKYATRFTFKFQNRKKYKPVDSTLVNAFIPGVIRDIFVNEGDEIKEGDSLLILEAMKMKNDLKSIRSGRIKKIHVTSGDNVLKNQLLIEFE